jgi:negative regulator of flagellin synthesis FlgM
VKIASTNPSRLQPAQSDATRAQQGGSAVAADSAGSQPGGATDASTSGADSSVSLSSLSSQLRSLAASGSADIDTAQVESIKSAIRNGTLQIDTGKIADGVLATARSLLTPSSGA